jgi:hypothetical protein
MMGGWYERTGIYSEAQVKAFRGAGIVIVSNKDLMRGIPWIDSCGTTRYIALRQGEIRARMRIPVGMSQAAYVRSRITR